MSDAPAKPSLFKIIQTDFIALSGLIFPLAAWGIYLCIDVFGFFPSLRGRQPVTAEGAPFFLQLALIVTVIGVPLAAWRINNMLSLFRNGAAVNGQVTFVNFFRDRGRIEYAYTYQGQAYKGGNAIMKTRHTRDMRPGDAVTLVVDRANPKRALIQDLYVS